MEISTHDLEGTLRAAARGARAARAPAHPPGQPRGPVPGAHRHGAAPVIRRLLSILHARNLEFLRDRGTLLFTTLLPLMVVVAAWASSSAARAAAVQGRRRSPRTWTSRRTASCASATWSSSPSPDTASGLQKLTPPADRPAGGPALADALLGQHRLAQGLHRREAAARRAPGRPARGRERRRRALRRLAVPGHPRDEHDVQLPLRRRLRGACATARAASSSACTRRR